MTNVQPILRARGLMKRYGTVVAMNGADFDLYPGEIVAVIGDNGAGKSTMIKALSGALTPDHGEIELEGKTVHFRSPQDAREAGIETVYQNLALSPALSIADNMFLGRELRAPGIMGKFFRKMDKAAWAELKERLRGVFAAKSRDEWCEIMEGSDVCFAPVLTTISSIEYDKLFSLLNLSEIA